MLNPQKCFIGQNVFRVTWDDDSIEPRIEEFKIYQLTCDYINNTDCENCFIDEKTTIKSSFYREVYEVVRRNVKQKEKERKEIEKKQLASLVKLSKSFVDNIDLVKNFLEDGSRDKAIEVVRKLKLRSFDF